MCNCALSVVEVNKYTHIKLGHSQQKQARPFELDKTTNTIKNKSTILLRKIDVFGTSLQIEKTNCEKGVFTRKQINKDKQNTKVSLLSISPKKLFIHYKPLWYMTFSRLLKFPKFK